MFATCDKMTIDDTPMGQVYIPTLLVVIPTLIVRNLLSAIAAMFLT
jgi:hypothetical protein